MSRTVRPSLPPVSTDGRADARGSVTVSLDTGRAILAALAGLTPHPWQGVIDEGSGWTEADLPAARSLSIALVGVPATPEGIIAAVDAKEARGDFESDNNRSFWRPFVRSLGDGRFEWAPWNGNQNRTIILHFRGDETVISWRSANRSRFIGRVVAWASPRSVAVAPMVGHSGPIRSF